MLITGLVSLVLLAFAFPAAQATPPAAEPAIPPVVWELVTLTGADGVVVEIADPSLYTVQFLTDALLTRRSTAIRAAAATPAAG
jgi:hypothetical protein